MLAALKEILFGGQSSSKDRAKSRLHFVLVQDRTGLDGDELGDFKEELIEVMERYFVIDKSGFDISYERDLDATTLVINSPVIVRRQAAPDGKVGARRQHEEQQTRAKTRRKSKQSRAQRKRTREKQVDGVEETSTGNELASTNS